MTAAVHPGDLSPHTSWVARFRLLPALATAVVPAVLAVATLLTSGDLEIFLFLATVAVGIGWATVYWPEFLVLGYFLAGRYGFEDRLAPGDLPFSANQLALVAVIGLMVVHQRHVIAILRTWTASVLVVVTVTLTVGILWSRGPEYGTYKVMHTLLVVLPCSLVMLALIHRRRSMIPFFAALFGIGMGLDAVGLATFETSVQVARLTSLGSGPIVLARVIGAALLVVVLGGIHLLRRRDRSWWSTGLGVACLLASLPLFAGFVLTQSRGPSLSLVLSLGLYAAVSSVTDWRRLVAILVLTGAALFGAELMIAEFAEWSRFDMDHQSNVVSLDGRMEMLWLSLDVVLGSPIFGVGTGGWPVAVYGLDMRTYPHNLFVEIAAEHGVVVVGLLIALFLGMVARWVPAYRRAGDDDRALLLLTLVLFVFSIVNTQVSGDLIDNRLMWILLGAMELAIVFSATRTEAGGALVRAALRRNEELQADATGEVGPTGP